MGWVWVAQDEMWLLKQGDVLYGWVARTPGSDLWAAYDADGVRLHEEGFGLVTTAHNYLMGHAMQEAGH